MRFRPLLEHLEDRLAPAVNLSIADPLPFPEGDSGTTNMVFTVIRSGDTAPGVTVDYATQDGTAIAGTDYVATSGTLSFAANQTTATITVPIIGNDLLQSNRTFTVTLSNPVQLSVEFAAQEAFATGNNAWSVAVGDVNGDGRPDLAVANDGSATVSVLLSTTAPGDTAPTFATQQAFATGINPESVAFADFDGDGRPDLAVANAGSHTVSVLLNTTTPGDTTPSFAPQQTFATDTSPYSLAVGDFDGDGRPDLVTANHNSDTVSVLLNATTPGGTLDFATQQTFDVGDGPRSVAVGDIDGDGRLDLVVANQLTSTVSVLLNATTPGGTLDFATQQTFATGTGPRFVAVGDVNGDGWPDLAVANTDVSTVSVLLNTTAPGDPAASFAPQQSFTTGSSPVSVAFGDFDGDGRPDLAVANRDSHTVSVLLNTTTPDAVTPSLAAQQPFAAGVEPSSVAVGDVNGDGRPDLAVTDALSGTVSVLLNTTTPSGFAAQEAFATGNNAWSVAVGDVNGDGRPDLAVANDGSATVSVLLSTTAPGDTVPSFDAQQAFATGINPESVAFADFNGDGRPDLAVANAGSHTVSVLLNATTPGGTLDFATQQTFATDTSPYSLAVGDFDGDGRPDLVTANHNSDTVSVLLNATTPGGTLDFATQQTFDVGDGPRSVAVGDIDGDGRLDLIVADQLTSKVSVLLNTTTQGDLVASFASQQIFDTGTGPRFVAVGDVNGDGQPDLAVANTDASTVSVLLNTTTPGDPSFATQQSFTTGTSPVSVAFGDFDGDGRPDLAVANRDSHTVSVLLNTTATGDTAASFAPQQSFAADGEPSSVAVGDVNGDGRPDLAVTNAISGTVSVLLNNLEAITITGSPATGTIQEDDTAVDDVATTPEDTAIEIDVLANDTIDTGLAAISAVTDPAHGTAVVNDSGTPGDPTDDRIDYTPDPDFNGTDTFTYTIQDVLGGTSTATVTVNVTEVNDTPTANSQTPTTAEDTDVTITLTGGDPEEQTLTFTITSLPADGTLYQYITSGNHRGAQITATGTAVTDGQGRVVFAPDANENGSPYASFQFTATDNGTTNGAADPRTSPAATVTVHVTSVNDAPVNTVPGPQSVAKNHTLTFSVAAGNALIVTDVDAGTSLVQVTLSVTHGTLKLSTLSGLTFLTGDGKNDPTVTFKGTLAALNAALNGLKYTPAKNFTGTDSLTIVTDDLAHTGLGGALSDTDVVPINVVS